MNTTPSPSSRPIPNSVRNLPPEMQEKLLAMSTTELLDEALRLVKGLQSTLDETFGPLPGPVDLSSLTLDEKLELGKRNCRALCEIAMQVAPEKTLDRMEDDLAGHDDSRAEAQALLHRVQPPKAS